LLLAYMLFTGWFMSYRRYCTYMIFDHTYLSSFHFSPQVLNINSTRLNQWPSSLSQLTKVISLDASNNALTTIPADAFTHTISLTSLALDSCGLTSFPVSVRNLTALTSLSLSNNRLHSIPDDAFVGSLSTTLEDLDLSNTQMSGVPVALQETEMVSVLLTCTEGELTLTSGRSAQRHETMARFLRSERQVPERYGILSSPWTQKKKQRLLAIF